MSEGRVAIVTGATSGIGFATAIRLASDGMHVVGIGRRAERLRDLVASADGGVTPLAIDLTKPGSEDRIVRAARDRGALRVLICNAGFGVKRPFLEADPDDWSAMFELNVLSTMRLCAASARAMEPGSTILLVSSVAGLRGIPGESGYSASKAAVNSLGESLRIELKDAGIRVSVLCPGTVRTEFELRSMSAEEADSAYAEQDPLEPAEVSELIAAIVGLPLNVSVGRVDVRPLRQTV